MPRNFCSKHLPPAPSFKPTINPTVPDFARLHANLERRQETFKLERNLTTIPRPFSLGDTAVRKMSSKEQSTPPSSDKSAESQNKFQRRRSQSVNRGFDSLVRPTKAFSLLTAFSKMKFVSLIFYPSIVWWIDWLAILWSTRVITCNSWIDRLFDFLIACFIDRLIVWLFDVFMYLFLDWLHDRITIQSKCF